MDKVKALGLQPGHLKSYPGLRGIQGSIERPAETDTQGSYVGCFLWKPDQYSLINIMEKVFSLVCWSRLP